jgi:DNA-directed RNA polymerase subunit omega
MARVTVEDCILVVENRFELVALAARRGKDISAGAPIFVSRDNDKNAVIALREIAAEKIPVSQLRNSLIQSMQKPGIATGKDNAEEKVESEKRDEGEIDVVQLEKEVMEEIESLSEVSTAKEDQNLFGGDDVEVED